MLPPNAIWMSFQVTPASCRAARTASAPMSNADFPGNRPKGCRPTPMIATSSMVVLVSSVVGLDGREREVHELVSFFVRAEGHELWAGKVVTPQSGQREPINRGSSAGQVNRPSANGTWVMRASVPSGSAPGTLGPEGQRPDVEDIRVLGQVGGGGDLGGLDAD